jgi:hypothetical protein
MKNRNRMKGVAFQPPVQLDLFAPPPPAIDDRTMRGWRCTIGQIQWRRLDPACYLRGRPISDWYERIIRANLHSVGGFLGEW